MFFSRSPRGVLFWKKEFSIRASRGCFDRMVLTSGERSEPLIKIFRFPFLKGNKKLFF